MKRYLLDTHVVLWFFTLPRKLHRRTQSIIERADCSVSTISIWELLNKQAARRIRLPEQPLTQLLQAAQMHVLPLMAAHVEDAAAMTDTLHGDPFDRLLIGTARSERMVLLTRDAQILDRAAPLLGDLLFEA